MPNNISQLDIKFTYKEVVNKEYTYEQLCRMNWGAVILRVFKNKNYQEIKNFIKEEEKISPTSIHSFYFYSHYAIIANLKFKQYISLALLAAKYFKLHNKNRILKYQIEEDKEKLHVINFINSWLKQKDNKIRKNGILYTVKQFDREFCELHFNEIYHLYQAFINKNRYSASFCIRHCFQKLHYKNYSKFIEFGLKMLQAKRLKENKIK